MLMNGDKISFIAIEEFFGLIIKTLDFVKFNINLLATAHLLTEEISEDT